MKKTLPGTPLKKLRKLKMVKPVTKTEETSFYMNTIGKDSYLMFKVNVNKKPA